MGNSARVSNFQIEDWEEELPLNGALLPWLIDTEKILESDYLEIAREFYGLASLEINYFEDHQTLPIWQKYHSVYKWSAQCLPIMEWDGILFVACLEPPEVSFEVPVQFVLAPRKALLNLWMQFHAEQDNSEQYQKVKSHQTSTPMSQRR